MPTRTKGDALNIMTKPETYPTQGKTIITYTRGNKSLMTILFLCLYELGKSIAYYYLILAKSI